MRQFEQTSILTQESRALEDDRMIQSIKIMRDSKNQKRNTHTKRKRRASLKSHPEALYLESRAVIKRLAELGPR